MLTNIRYILLTALRDFLFVGLLLGIVISVAISATLGNTAMVEKEAMQVVFSAASVRIILMLGIIVFISFHIRQAFEYHEIDVLLSRPISRLKIMISYWLGFSLVSLLLVLATITILSFLKITSLSGYAVWSVALAAESLIIVAIALFSSFTLSSAVSSVLASTGFYVIGRMMAFFVATSQSRVNFGEAWINSTIEFVIQAISTIIPRLDLFSQSEWLVYGLTRSADIQIILWQTVIYVPLLIIAATIDFSKKEF